MAAYRLTAGGNGGSEASILALQALLRDCTALVSSPTRVWANRAVSNLTWRRHVRVADGVDVFNYSIGGGASLIGG
jgi:hypothetical protein